MKPVLVALSLLIIATNIILSLPRAVNLVSTQTLAANVPSNKIRTQGETADVSKLNPIPRSLGLEAPKLTAAAALVKDLNSDTILYLKDPDKRVPIASTTKIMTALVATSFYQANDNLLVVNGASVSGSSMGLKAKEVITFRSLLYGMLLNSGNDAAYTIAENYPGGVGKFVEAMNTKAGELGLKNTHFQNPAGFDSADHYSSAYDLAKIAEAAIANSQLALAVSTREASVTSIDKSKVHYLRNLNILLDEPGFLGIKTGYTPEAKENFVGLVQRDNHKILTVVLGSDDRFGETERLVGWTFENFTW